MFLGYLQLGGKELINVARTDAYIQKIAPNIPIESCIDCGDLQAAIDDTDPYESPMVDDAPWYDPNQPETNGFFGFYPLEVEGVRSSTRMADVVESVQDGGTIGEARFGTRAMRWRGVMVAKDDLALDAGMAWLRAALTADPCQGHGGGSCGGAMMCYYAACPCVIDKFTQTYQAGSTIPLSMLSGYETIQDLRSVTGIWKARLAPVIRDGQIVRWGVLDNITAAELQSTGPVVLRRRNLMSNPSFTRDLDYWTPSAETTITRQTAGGVDETGYMHVEGSPPFATRFNYFADPGFENLTPEQAGITSGTDMPVEIGQTSGAWQGLNYLTQQPTLDPVILSGFKITHEMTFPILGPTTPAAGVVSLYYRQQVQTTNNAYNLDILDPDGVVVGSADGDLLNVTGWTRINAWGTFGEGYSVRFRARRSTGQSLQAMVLNVDGIQAEVGGSLTAWFSGDSPDVHPTTHAWSGVADASTSLAYSQFTGALLRTNLVTNPSFENGTGAWTTDDGLPATSISYPSDGGVSGTRYSRRTLTSAETVAIEGGLRYSHNTFTIGATYTYSVYVRVSVAQRFEVAMVPVGGGVAYIDHVEDVPANTWTRLSLTATVPTGATDMRFSIRAAAGGSGHMWQVGETIDIDAALIEAGTALLPYFDGSTGALAVPGVIYEYAGTPADYSIEVSGDMTSVTSAPMIADFGVGHVSMQVKSELPGTVISVAQRSVVDDTIVTTALINPERDWREFNFGVASLDNTYLDIRAIGPYDVDQVIGEVGSIVLPYFDADMDPEVVMSNFKIGLTPEYSVEWIGGSVDGPSEMLWLGEMTFGIPIDVDYDETEEGVCNAVPFLDIIQGQISGDLSVGIRTRISVAEQVEPYERYMHDVACIEGPTEIQRLPTKNGALMEVSFTLVAGVPHAFAATRTPLFPTVMANLPTSAWLDTTCASDEMIHIVDPDCPPIPDPPRPPEIVNSCIEENTAWQRYWLSIPSDFGSVWSDMVPAVTISTGPSEIRQVRVRVYPDPFDRGLLEFFSRRNVHPNPRAIAPSSATGWSTALTGTASAVTGLPAQFGVTTGFRNTATATRTSLSILNEPVPGLNLIRPGELYTVAMSFNASYTVTGVDVEINFFNDVGGGIGSEIITLPGFAANTWSRVETVAGIATPPGTNDIMVRWYVKGSVVAGSTLTAMVPMIELESTYESGTYFDGSFATTDGIVYDWEGVENLSASTALRSPIDPCGWCSEFVLSYLPANTELTVDALTQMAYAHIAGSDAVPANSLLYGSDGGPITWPALSCGISYIIAIDVPEPLLDDVTVGVQLTRREVA